MSFPYKNPISNIQLSGPQTVTNTSVFGTTFSSSLIGGYMEVFNLSDLGYSTYNQTGLITNSGNTIPIHYTVGSNANTLTLNSDNISSGRRRLGMLVYVQETNTVYQHTIRNYETLWSALSGLTGLSAVTFSTFTTPINTRSQVGVDFINNWLD